MMKEDKEAQEKIGEPDYSMGNIILANHIQLEARIKMIKEIMEAHGYRKLPKDPPLLSDGEINVAMCCIPEKDTHLQQWLSGDPRLIAIAQAQREADIKHCGGAE